MVRVQVRKRRTVYDVRHWCDHLFRWRHACRKASEPGYCVPGTSIEYLAAPGRSGRSPEQCLRFTALFFCLGDLRLGAAEEVMISHRAVHAPVSFRRFVRFCVGSPPPTPLFSGTIDWFFDCQALR
jgi:hypothetical protein